MIDQLTKGQKVSTFSLAAPITVGSHLLSLESMSRKTASCSSMSCSKAATSSFTCFSRLSPMVWPGMGMLSTTPLLFWKYRCRHHWNLNQNQLAKSCYQDVVCAWHWCLCAVLFVPATLKLMEHILWIKQYTRYNCVSKEEVNKRCVTDVNKMCKFWSGDVGRKIQRGVLDMLWKCMNGEFVMRV